VHASAAVHDRKSGLPGRRRAEAPRRNPLTARPRALSLGS
jgi:hypothetical protein